VNLTIAIDDIKELRAMTTVVGTVHMEIDECCVCKMKGRFEGSRLSGSSHADTQDIEDPDIVIYFYQIA